MYFTEKTITVKSGQGELKLGEINLPATRLALLEGMPAPELGGAASWKNGPPVKLTELKGKCVLLDFWGYWCGPCVHQMPELFELYDKYNHQGLEIVGIHIDLGEDETTPVDSAEKLDARLTAKRKNLWKGRDIPFPVALFCGKRVPYGADVDGKARASISAQYGVMLYPTTILIDRQGNVVGRFAPQQQNDIDQLEKLLGEKQPN
jgi:thiol-disulfide isomerase/thioredoxin